MTPGVLGKRRRVAPGEEPPIERDAMTERSGTAAEPIPRVLFRQQSFVEELLDAHTPATRQSRCSLRIDAEAVQVKELSGLPAGPADGADLLERLPIQDRDALVGTVRDVQEALLRIGR